MSYKISNRVINVIRDNYGHKFTLIRNGLNYSGYIPLSKFKIDETDEYMKYHIDRKFITLDERDNQFTLRLPKPFEYDASYVVLEQPELTKLREQIDELKKDIKEEKDNRISKHLTANNILGCCFIVSSGCIIYGVGSDDNSLILGGLTGSFLATSISVFNSD